MLHHVIGTLHDYTGGGFGGKETRGYYLSTAVAVAANKYSLISIRTKLFMILLYSEYSVQ